MTWGGIWNNGGFKEGILSDEIDYDLYVKTYNDNNGYRAFSIIRQKVNNNKYWSKWGQLWIDICYKRIIYDGKHGRFKGYSHLWSYEMIWVYCWRLDWIRDEEYYKLLRGA